MSPTDNATIIPIITGTIPKVLTLIIDSVHNVIDQHSREPWVDEWKSLIPKNIGDIKHKTHLSRLLGVPEKKHKIVDLFQVLRTRYKIIDTVVEFSLDDKNQWTARAIQWESVPSRHTRTPLAKAAIDSKEQSVVPDHTRVDQSLDDETRMARENLAKLHMEHVLALTQQKNNHIKELEDVKTRIHRGANGAKSELDKVHEQIQADEVNCLSKINGIAKSEIEKINKCISNAESIYNKLSDKNNFFSHLDENLNVKMRSISSIFENKFEELIQDIHHTVQDAKEEYLLWTQDHSFPPGNTPSNINRMQNVSQLQQELEASLARSREHEKDLMRLKDTYEHELDNLRQAQPPNRRNLGKSHQAQPPHVRNYNDDDLSSDSRISFADDSILHDNTSPPHAHPHQGLWRPDKSSLAEYEFEYPVGTRPKRIHSLSFLKAAKEWSFQLRQKDDIKQFYNSFQNRLFDFNILLRPYEQITHEGGLESITKMNCLNYESARNLMSRTLFSYFEDNKDTIFEYYSDPVHIFDAFKLNMDGLGFLKELLTEIHPNLKAPTTDCSPTKPRFEKYNNIHTFINAFVIWINDEIVKGRRYSDQENISYILSNLDDRFDKAKSKIERAVTEGCDPQNKSKFPFKWTLTNKSLSLDILKEIPQEDRDTIDFSNTVSFDQLPSVHKVSSRKSFYNDSISRSYRKDRDFRTKSSTDSSKHRWAKTLKWKYIPGAFCQACGKNNHDVYETGCPTLATFCNCKAFFDQHDPNEIQPVIDAFQEYQKSRRDDKQRAKKYYGKLLQNMDGDKSSVKKAVHTAYYTDFPEDEKLNLDFETVVTDHSYEDDNSI